MGLVQGPWVGTINTREGGGKVGPAALARPRHQVRSCLPTPRRRLQVICCSGARSTITADLARVDDVGVANLAKAFMDELVGCGRCRKNRTFGCREIPICVQADHTGCDL